MNQTITTRKDVDECTELSDADNTTIVDRTEFCLRRIDDCQNTSLGVFHSPCFDSTDRHNADNSIVVDSNVGASFLLDGVDDLALWSNDFADLVHRNGDRNNLWSSLCHSVTALGNCRVHDLENCHPSFFGLLQSRCQDIGGNAINLGIELQCSHYFRSSGNLEVHVTESIFGSQNVSQAEILTLGVDESHSDTCNGCLDWHTGIHQRQAA
ncbi:unannotated protein [freshwater metagenome]|uniref:Unannotated protein n=1 Tax=freshwater metagenome TaxID=449393 RepID=A0A6J7M1B9_9ZZZZ